MIKSTEELTEDQFQQAVIKIRKHFSLHAEITLERVSNGSPYEVSWDETNHCYRIRYVGRRVDYFLLHEIGHVLIAERTAYHPFACFVISLAYTVEYPETEVISNYANTLIDAFVNHLAFRVEDLYYPLYREAIDWVLDQPFPDREFHENLAYYLFFYLDFNYNLKDEDKRSRLQKFNLNLSHLETLIMEESTLDLQQLKCALDQFQTLTDMLDVTKILQFISKILTTLNQWNPNILREFLEYIFPPLIKNKKGGKGPFKTGSKREHRSQRV